MIRILSTSGHGTIGAALSLDDLSSAFKDLDNLLWIDFAGEPLAQVEAILKDVFNFHPLAIDDALNENHAPKVNDWQDYLFIVLRAAHFSGDQVQELLTRELDIFMGPNYIVTYSQEASETLDRLWAVCQQDQSWMKQGISHMLYWIADELVSKSVGAVESMQVELDQIEDQLFDEATPDTLERIFTLKRNTLHLRRIVVPQKDVLNKLARNNYQVIKSADRIFFRDVSDHLLQLDILLDDMVVLVSGTRETYMSVVNNRINDIMKTLTVITAFFMPLAFITGFFGMNFFQPVMPFAPWTGSTAFFAALAAMLLAPLLMFTWMRHRSWI